jgi:lysophospholipase L1-like esterase
MEKKTENQGPLILFTGDSITDGNRYKKKEQAWDLNHQIGHTYAYIVNGMLGSAYPEKRFRFRSKGVSGNRIVDLYARNEVDLYPLQPDILSVLVGVNDGPIDRNNYEATPVEKYERIYRIFLEEVGEHLPHCKILLMEPFVCPAGRLREEGTYPIWRKAVSGYGAVVRNLAKEFGTGFLPLQQLFDEKCAAFEPEYWCWDGIHPTENGHGLIAREWMWAMRETLGLPLENR